MGSSLDPTISSLKTSRNYLVGLRAIGPASLAIFSKWLYVWRLDTVSRAIALTVSGIATLYS